MYAFVQYADLSNTTYPNLSKTVFAIFMVLVPILLLNMLIAMMGNTYAHVIEQSEKEFVKQVGVNIIHDPPIRDYGKLVADSRDYLFR